MKNKENNLRVLVLCNNAFLKGNGICTAVQALRDRLREAGVDARLMATANDDPEGPQADFPLGHFVFPVFEPLVYANGFRYAKADRKKIREAVQWADVVHIQEAFPLEVIAVNIARELGKPIVGTFHLYPENITANLGIGRENFIATAILCAWRDLCYNKCSHIQCPTEFVRQHLLKHKFTSDMRVISNGIEIPEVQIRERVSDSSGRPIRILCIGRLSNEKDQMTLLKAMRYSRYAGDILLQFAGKGPFLKKYRKFAGKLMKEGILKYEPEFGFYNRNELRDLCRDAYLYIHCAWVEVEGLSCVEALREGLVPVISEGILSATSQFALDERSVYPVFDARALAARIDWWIEHPAEYAKMSVEYAESAKRYEQSLCTKEIIQMYHDAINQVR